MMDDDCAKRSGTAAAQNYDHLNNMSADELLEQLESAFDQMTEESFDPAVIDAYLDVMDEKEPVNISIDVEKEWEGFSRAHGLTASDTPRKRKVISFGRGRRLAVIAAAVIVVLSVAVMAGAMGYTAQANWNEEHFTFDDMTYMSSGERNPPNYDNWYEGKEYGSLQEILDDFEVTEFAEPKSPKGYSLASTYVHVDAECDELVITAVYRSDESKYNLNVDCDYIPEGTEPKYYFEKNEGDPETFFDGERTYYLFSNMQTNDIVWLTDNYVCYISGEVSFEELIKMVKSIY